MNSNISGKATVLEINYSVSTVMTVNNPNEFIQNI